MAQLYVWGSNAQGRLGNGIAGDTVSPSLVPGDWRNTPGSFSSAAGHTVGIKSDGTLWTWGNNSQGQLGQGAGAASSVQLPTQVGTATDWAKVSASWEHTVALKNDGSLWGWGAGSTMGTAVGTVSTPTPTVLMAGAWLDVANSFDNTYAIKSDGSLWATGRNTDGQLGVGNLVNRAAFTQESGLAVNWTKLPSLGYTVDNSYALKTGVLFRAGAPFLAGVAGAVASSTFVASAVGAWNQISTSGGHTLGIKTDGTLWAWGFNGNGRLGDGTEINSAIPIQVGSASNWVAAWAGYDHSAAANAVGQVYTWGRNFSGNIGDGTFTDRFVPTLVLTGVGLVVAGTETTFALTSGVSLPPAFWTSFIGSQEVL